VTDAQLAAAEQAYLEAGDSTTTRSSPQPAATCSRASAGRPPPRPRGDR